jgi:hypothetical protein
VSTRRVLSLAVAALVSGATAACLETPVYEGLGCSVSEPCPAPLICSDEGRCRLPEPVDAGRPGDGGAADADGGLRPDAGPPPVDAGPADAGEPALERCADPPSFPAEGWEGRHFELGSDGEAGDCIGVEDVGGADLQREYGALGPRPRRTDRFVSEYRARRRWAAGVYSLVLRHDDGVRVRLDGALVYDAWREGAVSQAVVRTAYLPAGEHELLVEHFDATGAAFVEVRLESGCGPLEPPSRGWLVSYHRATAQGVDPSHCFGVDTVDTEGFGADWNDRAPPPVFASGTVDGWGLVAVGRRRFRGESRFVTSYDDGLRVRVSDTQVLDGFTGGPATDRRFAIYARGEHVVRLEMFDLAAQARLSVGWSQACEAAPVTAPDRWTARYFRVTEDSTTQPPTWALDRDDCLGSETLVGERLAPAFSGDAPGPVSALNITDRFGAEYLGRRDLPPGTVLQATHDDGLRIYSGATSIYDSWTAPQVVIGAMVTAPAGAQTLRLEYFENLGGAQLSLTW